MYKIAEDVWIEQQEFHVPIFGNIGVTMTVAKMDSDQVAVICPIRPAEQLIQQVKKQGSKIHLIAPNSEHHLFLPEWIEAFPAAKVYGPPSLEEKKPEIKFATILDGTNQPFLPAISCHFVLGRGGLEENILFHHPSKTAIFTDSAFNLDSGDGWIQRRARSLNNIGKGFAITRLGRALFSDKLGLEKQIRSLHQLGPEKLIVAHGRPVLEDAKAALLKGYNLDA